jgi:uncharacterized membrane protein
MRGGRQAKSGEGTSKTRQAGPDRLRAEYDFSAGVRGKHHAAYAAARMVELEADVARAFPDSAAVNRALRAVLRQRAGTR